jgi:hypothetical protein
MLLLFGSAHAPTRGPVHAPVRPRPHAAWATYSATTRTVRSSRSLAPRIEPPSSSVPRM